MKLAPPLLSLLTACSAAKAPAPVAKPAATSAPQPAPKPSSSVEYDGPSHVWFGLRGGAACSPDASGKPCDPGLSCFPKASGGICAQAVTAAELLANEARYRGLVGLRHASVGYLISCTSQGCGSANPCCNGCSARAYLPAEGSDLILLVDYPGATASGDECNIRDRTEISGAPHAIVGRLRSTSVGLALRIEHMTPETPTP